MKEFKNFDEAKKNAEYTGTEQIPVGAYVAKIMGVRYENGQNGNSDRIVIQFDIAEGEQKDFFAKQYEQNTADDKKWKGKTTIYVPKDDGTQKDQWTANTFARWVNAIEKSMMVILGTGMRTNGRIRKSVLFSVKLVQELKIKMLSMLNVDSQLQLMMLRMENARFQSLKQRTDMALLPIMQLPTIPLSIQ